MRPTERQNAPAAFGTPQAFMEAGGSCLTPQTGSRDNDGLKIAMRAIARQMLANQSVPAKYESYLTAA